VAARRHSRASPMIRTPRYRLDNPLHLAKAINHHFLLSNINYAFSVINTFPTQYSNINYTFSVVNVGHQPILAYVYNQLVYNQPLLTSLLVPIAYASSSIISNKMSKLLKIIYLYIILFIYYIYILYIFIYFSLRFVGVISPTF